jgi:hypothetical protein
MRGGYSTFKVRTKKKERQSKDNTFVLFIGIPYRKSGRICRRI